MEYWKDINGFEGLYQVSNQGRIKNKHNKVLSLRKDKGYFKVHLWKNSVSKWFLVHRLVAKAFIENPYNLPQVNHKDEDKTNNKVENLEWCTFEYNMNYGTRNERCSTSQLNSQKKSKQIAVYKYPSMVLIGIFPSTNEVKRQFKANNVSKVAKGIYKQEKGYTFRYV